MQRHTSIYLDLIRFGSALVVFVGHSSGQRYVGGLGWQVVPYMDEAVIFFFIISGFVIGYVTQQREVSCQDYALARAARIYSVALPAIVATIVIDAYARSVDPAWYARLGHYQKETHGLEFIGATVFVNYLWYCSYAVGSNLPYWSLCFEVWYYVLFGVLLFAPARWRWWATGALLLFVGPRIACYFPLWLLGVLAYRISASGKVGRGLGGVAFFGSVGLILLHQVWIARHGASPALLEAILDRPNIIDDYITAVLFACNVIGFNAIGASAAGLLKVVEKPIRWCAGATFTIYLFHMPVVLLLDAITPWPPTTWMRQLTIYGGTLVIAFAIAEFTERRKDAWRRGLARLSRLRPAAGVALR